MPQSAPVGPDGLADLNDVGGDWSATCGVRREPANLGRVNHSVYDFSGPLGELGGSGKTKHIHTFSQGVPHFTHDNIINLSMNNTTIESNMNER